MKRVIVLSLLAASALLAHEHWTGQIGDNMCGADHSAMAKEGHKADPHECANACVKAGGKYVFVSSGKVYEIANQNFEGLSEHAGHTVTLSGDVSADGKSITASDISMKQ